MTTLQMGSSTWVLLNNNRVVQEIIAKRGHITSERPNFPIASGLVSRGQRTVLRQTAQWTEGRRVMHALLSNSNALRSYGEWIELESAQLLAEYLCTPWQWYSHHYRYCNSIVHRIVLSQRLLKSTPELDEFQYVGVHFIRSSIIGFSHSLLACLKYCKPGTSNGVKWANTITTCFYRCGSQSKMLLSTVPHQRHLYKTHSYTVTLSSGEATKRQCISQCLSFELEAITQG